MKRNHNRIFFHVISFLGISGSLYLLRQPFSYSICLPSMYRVIYIPAVFWLYYGAYLFVSYGLLGGGGAGFKSELKKAVIPLFWLHIYILLGNLVADIYRDRGMLAGLYFSYIKSVFLAYTAIGLAISVKSIFSPENKKGISALLYPQFIFAAAYFISFHLVLRNTAFAFVLAVSALLGMALCFVDRRAVRDLFGRLFKSDMAVLVSIFLLAFIVRTAFSVMLVHKTTRGEYGYNGYLRASDDGDAYDMAATMIVNDPEVIRQGRVEIWGYWDRAYSFFLALCYKLFGRNFYAVTLIQAFLGSFIPVFTFLIAKMLFSRAIAIVSSSLISVKGGLIMLAAYMGHEAVWLPVLYAFLFIFTGYFRYPERSGLVRDAVMGILLGVTALLRSVNLYFIPFLCVWQLAFFWEIRIWRRIRNVFTVTAVSACVIMLAMGLCHNQARLVNRNKAATVWKTARHVPPFHNLGNERFLAIGINPVGDPAGSARAIMKDPLRFIALAAKIYPLRIIALFETFQFGVFDPVYMVNPAEMRNNFAPSLEFYFTLFFLVGLACAFFRKGILRSPLFLVLSFNAIFYCCIVFHATPRFKEISSPVVYIIGVYGAGELLKYLRKERGPVR